MFFSNNLGLLEYDGINWTLHAVKNETKVRSVLIGNDGRIYVGNQGDFGYFVRNEIGGLTYTSLADSLLVEDRNFDEIWNIYKNEEHSKAYSTHFSKFKELLKNHLNQT